MTATHAMFRLARELRYRELPIIGRRVVIESRDAVEHVLRQLATPWITRDSRWDGCDIVAGLAKYGLLDRWCNVDPRELEGGLRGVPVLRVNGFPRRAPDPDPVVAAQDRACAAGCLEDLAEELGPCVLKLFLDDQLPWSVRAPNLRELPRDYFPRPFIVTDACITNASGIWFEKHFYL
jgi:hypothetical protein